MAPFEPAPEIVAKLRSRKCAPPRRNASRRSDAASSPGLPARRGGLAREPGEEPAQRRAVAMVGGADAGELDRVLARLGQLAGIGGAAQRGAGGAEPLEDPGRRGAGIDLDPLAGGAEAVERPAEGIGRLHRDGVAEMALDPGHQLAAVDEELDRGVAARIAKDSGKGVFATSPPRTLSSQAIKFGRRQHRGVDTLRGQRIGQLLALLFGRLAGEAQLVRHDRRQRRRRLVAPDGVDRVALDRGEPPAGLDGGGGKPLDLARNMQPGIVAEHLPRLEVGGDPFGRRLLGQMAVFVERAVDLGADLQGVAAVAEHGGPIGQHDGEPGRAGEAGEPGEPLRPERHVLALVLVGARNDEAVEAASRQLGAERGEARRRILLRHGRKPAPLGKVETEGFELRRQGRGDLRRDEAGPVDPLGRREDARDQRLEPRQIIGRARFGEQPGENRIALILRPTLRWLAIHSRHLVCCCGKARPRKARRQ